MLGVAIRLDAPVVSADVVDAAPDAEETALTACAVTFPETVEALAADAETAVTIRAAVSGARRSSNIRVMLFSSSHTPSLLLFSFVHWHASTNEHARVRLSCCAQTLRNSPPSLRGATCSGERRLVAARRIGIPITRLHPRVVRVKSFLDQIQRATRGQAAAHIIARS
jgi:hypothetical protein